MKNVIFFCQRCALRKQKGRLEKWVSNKQPDLKLSTIHSLVLILTDVLSHVLLTRRRQIYVRIGK